MRLLFTVFPALIFVVHTMAVSTLLVFSTLVDRRGWLWWPVVNFWGWGALQLAGVRRVHIQGLAGLRGLNCAILMANHDSYLDSPLLLGYGPEPIRIVAKRSLFFIPVFNLAMWGIGMIPIDRSNKKRAISSLAKAAEQIRSGKVVLVFPEGTRSVGPQLGSFKKGGFMLALQSGAPIIPLGIAGTDAVLPPGWNTLGKSAVGLSVGAPILTEDLTVSDRASLMDTVHDAIQEQRRVARSLVATKSPEE